MRNEVALELAAVNAVGTFETRLQAAFIFQVSVEISFVAEDTSAVVI